MGIELVARIERWPVAGRFVIARGARDHVDVVVVEARDGDCVGRAEATPVYYRGETAARVVDLVYSATGFLNAPDPQHKLLENMEKGAARNALDGVAWDLAAKRAGKPLWTLLGLAPPRPLATAMTVSLGPPAEMERAARRLSGEFGLLKLKLAGEGDRERVAAARRGAPEARLIVDANESWTGRDLIAEAAALVPFGVELIEQPVAPGEDAALDGLDPPIPFCADESCHGRADLARCLGRYQAINIKLDKAGGLTEALALAEEARGAGLKIMVGCMLSTSLGIAPAFLLAQQADWVDLDGPLLLARDREDGFRFERGMIFPRSQGED